LFLLVISKLTLTSCAFVAFQRGVLKSCTLKHGIYGVAKSCVCKKFFPWCQEETTSWIVTMWLLKF
jgi:hypothetical protein